MRILRILTLKLTSRTLGCAVIPSTFLFEGDIYFHSCRTHFYSAVSFTATYPALPGGNSVFWDDDSAYNKVQRTLAPPIKPNLRCCFSWDGSLAQWVHRDGHSMGRTFIHPRKGRWCAATGLQHIAPQCQAEHHPLTALSRSSKRALVWTCAIRVRKPPGACMCSRPRRSV